MPNNCDCQKTGFKCSFYINCHGIKTDRPTEKLSALCYFSLNPIKMVLLIKPTVKPGTEGDPS